MRTLLRLGHARPLLTSASRAGAAARADVVVHLAQHDRRIAGFGVSEGFGEARALMDVPGSVQKRVPSLLFR